MLRSRRILALAAVAATLWLAVEVRLARAEDAEARLRQRLPADQPAATLDLPRGTEELLGLGLLAAIVYGLRVSELGRRGGQRSS
jgi:hypothetical protein